MNKNLSCIKIRLSGFSTEYVFFITGEMYRVSTKLVFHFSKRFIIWSYQSIRHVYNIINSIRTSFAVSTLRNSYYLPQNPFTTLRYGKQRYNYITMAFSL